MANGKARAVAWNLPDPVPVHREPIYTARPDLVAKYPTRPTAASSAWPSRFLDPEGAVDKDLPSNSRSSSLQGGSWNRRRRRGNAVEPLACELQQDMFVEVNTSDAAERGIKDGGWVWCSSGERLEGTGQGAGHRPRRQGRAFMPFHFAGWFQGVDQRGKYPKGNDPIVLGESVNTLTSYGYDPVTACTKAGDPCQIQSGEGRIDHGSRQISL